MLPPVQIQLRGTSVRPVIWVRRGPSRNNLCLPHMDHWCANILTGMTEMQHNLSIGEPPTEDIGHLSRFRPTPGRLSYR